MVLFHRIFAYYIYITGKDKDESTAKKDALDFSKIRESFLSHALC